MGITGIMSYDCFAYKAILYFVLIQRYPWNAKFWLFPKEVEQNLRVVLNLPKL